MGRKKKPDWLLKGSLFAGILLVIVMFAGMQADITITRFECPNEFQSSKNYIENKLSKVELTNYGNGNGAIHIIAESKDFEMRWNYEMEDEGTNRREVESALPKGESYQEYLSLELPYDKTLEEASFTIQYRIFSRPSWLFFSIWSPSPYVKTCEYKFLKEEMGYRKYYWKDLTII